MKWEDLMTAADWDNWTDTVTTLLACIGAIQLVALIVGALRLAALKKIAEEQERVRRHLYGHKLPGNWTPGHESAA
jgi:hypothetical protein